MPNQNQPDPNSQPAIPEATSPQTQPSNEPVSQPSGFVPPVISPQSDLPPLPPDFQNMSNPASGTSAPTPTSEPVTTEVIPPLTAATPTVTTPSQDTGSAAPPPDIPPMTTGNKKKFGTGKIIATILGLFLLIGGVGAGVILTQQQQLFQQKAKDCECGTSVGDCGGGYHCSSPTCGRCIPNATTAPPPPTPAQPPPPSNNKPICSSSSSACVGNNKTGDCYQGGQGNQYACYKLLGNPGFTIAGTTDCVCPTEYSWGPRQEYGSWWCFKTSDTSCTPGVVNGINTGEQCSLQPQNCNNATPTPPPRSNPTPTVPPANNAYCTDISTYDSNWTLISASSRSSLKSSDKIYFCVSGKFTTARFTINSSLITSPSTVQRTGSTDICQEYTIKSTDTSINVSAQVN